MRVGLALLLGLVLLALPGVLGERGCGAAPAKPPPPRYGIAADLKAYPQSSPKQALTSVLKAIDAGRFDYLLAHLADPAFVDDRVKRVYGGRFAEQVEDTQAHLGPLAVKQLRRFLKEGEWALDKSKATVRLKALPKRLVRLRLRDGRWYLDHPFAPPKRAPKKPED
jgi:hypothetical protein